jgi:hypothetical protein
LISGGNAPKSMADPPYSVERRDPAAKALCRSPD